MLDRTQTIEKLKTTRQYLDEHYGVHSMTLFGSLARNEQREDSDVDICVEMVPNLFNRAGVKIRHLIGVRRCRIKTTILHPYIIALQLVATLSSACSRIILSCVINPNYSYSARNPSDPSSGCLFHCAKA